MGASSSSETLVTTIKFILEEAMKAQRGWRYSSTLSLTSELEGVGGQRHALDALPPGEAGSAPGPVWAGTENHAPTGIRSPDRPAGNYDTPR